MTLLPRLFRRYRGNFPAAPVESAPMVVENKLVVVTYCVGLIVIRDITTIVLRFLALLLRNA